MIRITGSEFLKSAVKPDEYISSSFPDIAFVGRSNVGKSSLINTLLQRKNIAKISSTPGKTRLINFFRIFFKTDKTGEKGIFNFIDLPGYGYARVSKTEREKWRSMIGNYFNNRLNLRGVILLVDIRRSADEKDKLMLELLRERGINSLVVATKADKIALTKRKATAEKLAAGLGIRPEEIYLFSALKKFGMEAIMDWIESLIL